MVKKKSKIVIAMLDIRMRVIKPNIKYYTLNNLNCRKFLMEYGIKEL